MMKPIIILAFFGLFANKAFAQQKLEKIWQTDTTLVNPESARFDPKAKLLYVSNIGIRGKEGTGFISKVGLDGKILNNYWVTGLTACKGLGLYKNMLYAAEPTAVAVIDTGKAAIVQRIQVEGAIGLNDITVDSQGIVYVSDFSGNKVYRIENGKASVYLENLRMANGVLAVGSDLYILANNQLQKADANKNLTPVVTGLETFPDGVEMVKPGEFVVTIYGGIIYYVKSDGSKQVMIDTRQGPSKTNSCDLGFDPSTNMIYVPTVAKTLIAYKLTDSVAQTPPLAETLPPVETLPPTADYKPAFPGQTRAPGAKTTTPIIATVINSELKSPFALRCLPDGRFLITEKPGAMRILKTDGSFDKNIEGLPKVSYGYQGGLLDVNYDVTFTKDRTLFWTYSEQIPEGYLLAVAKGVLSADETKLENVRVIYRAIPATNSANLQFGSRIVFDKQGNLFVSTGDRSVVEMRVKSQNLNAATGKIVHITRDGKPVPGGPFAKTPGALPEIYAYGVRNPEGMETNPATGDLWEAEFGPRGGDEVNIIKAGSNYGWPVITYGIEYRGAKLTIGDGIQQKEGMTQPIYYWNPSISPCGITFYQGDLIPEWKGNLFLACLSGVHICRLIIKDDKVVAEERLLVDKAERWRSLVTGKDGALYGVTDSGKLYRIAK